MNTLFGSGKNRRSGFSLIEVMVAVLVLATGMLALAAMQATITKNSADAKSRSQVVAFADGILERLRTRNFENISIGLTQGNLIPTTELTAIQDRAVVSNLAVNANVRHYIPNPATAGAFIAITNPSDVRLASIGDSSAQYKEVQLTVSYTDSINQTRTVSIVDIISPLAIKSDGSLISRPVTGSTQPSPKVRTSVPETAGVIPIAVGDDQSTAATNPKPEIDSRGNIRATRFDVLTYQAEGSDAIIQRRVETKLISCRCNFQAPPSGTNAVFAVPFRPTYWDGTRYARPDTNQQASITVPAAWGATLDRREPPQDELCNDCCRDHHDPSTAVIKYSPFETTHGHFRLSGGVLTNAGSSGEYLESCRFVRVDGRQRTAPDMKMLHMNLLETANSARGYVPSVRAGDSYEAFVIGYLNQKRSPISSVNTNAVDAAALELANLINRPATLSIVKGTGDRRYLHDRSLYLEFLVPDARTRIAEEAARCTGLNCALAYFPFVSVNTTELAIYSPQTTQITVASDSGVFGQPDVAPIRGAIGTVPASTVGHVTAANVVIGKSNSGLASGAAISPNDLVKATDSQAVVVTDASGIIDSDGDGAEDLADNCPTVANADQADLDRDGIGNVCDPDRDGDGVTNSPASDNCPDNPNADQLDVDRDGIGDVCDNLVDSDGDTIADSADNCPNVSNVGQADYDGDREGDACDTDLDGDTVDNGSDNCPNFPNTDQLDVLPRDGVGDACQNLDQDLDGIVDLADNCPSISNRDQLDGDGDRIGDVCDNCVADLNFDQADGENDGVGDVCDNCQSSPNPDQLDTDRDGVGDVCELPVDTDGDGVADASDNCPLVANPSQADRDRDGLGDACDTQLVNLSINLISPTSSGYTSGNYPSIGATVPPTPVANCQADFGQGTTSPARPDNNPSPYTCQVETMTGTDAQLYVRNYNRASTTRIAASSVCTGARGNVDRPVCYNYSISQVRVNGAPILSTFIGTPSAESRLSEQTIVSIPALLLGAPNALEVTISEQVPLIWEPTIASCTPAIVFNTCN